MTDTDTKKTAKEGPVTPDASLVKKGEHSMGGVTTRDDALDLGVPMLPGDPGEPVGPEDALGPGPKRGDYSGRLLPGESYVSIPNPDYSPPRVRDDGGVDEVPTTVLVLQSKVGPDGKIIGGRAAERGEVAKLKGGVDTEDKTSHVVKREGHGAQAVNVEPGSK